MKHMLLLDKHTWKRQHQLVPRQHDSKSNKTTLKIKAHSYSLHADNYFNFASTTPLLFPLLFRQFFPLLYMDFPFEPSTPSTNAFF